MADNGLRRRAAEAARRRDSRIAAITASNIAAKAANAQGRGGEKDGAWESFNKLAERDMEMAAQSDDRIGQGLSNRLSAMQGQAFQALSESKARKEREKEAARDRNFQAGQRDIDRNLEERRTANRLAFDRETQSTNSGIARDQLALNRDKVQYDRALDYYNTVSAPENRPANMSQEQELAYNATVKKARENVLRLQNSPNSGNVGSDPVGGYISETLGVQQQPSYRQYPAAQPQTYSYGQPGVEFIQYSQPEQIGVSQRPRSNTRIVRDENGNYINVDQSTVDRASAAQPAAQDNPHTARYGNHQVRHRMVPRGTVSGQSDFLEPLGPQPQPVSYQQPAPYNIPAVDDGVVAQKAREVIRADRSKVKPGEDSFGSPNHWISQPLSSGEFYQGAGDAIAGAGKSLAKLLAPGAAKARAKNKAAVAKAIASQKEKRRQDDQE